MHRLMQRFHERLGSLSALRSKPKSGEELTCSSLLTSVLNASTSLQQSSGLSEFVLQIVGCQRTSSHVQYAQ